MPKFKYGWKHWDKKPKSLPPWPDSIAPLSREEEKEAIISWQQEGDLAARDRIIQANVRFVVSVAKPWAHHGLPMSDLVAEGILGLLVALDRFELERGLKFISYAVWWIRQKMMSAIHNNRVITVPEHYRQLWHEYRCIESERLNSGHDANFDDIAHTMDLNAVQAQGLRLMVQSNVSLQKLTLKNSELDQYILDRFISATQAHFDVEGGPENRERAEKIDMALADLDDRERLILTRYYGLDGKPPQTLSEIGQQLNITRERVRQIKGKICNKLRHLQPLRTLHAEMDL